MIIDYNYNSIFVTYIILSKLWLYKHLNSESVVTSNITSKRLTRSF